MVIVVRILLLELGPLLIHVVIHQPQTINVQDKMAPVIAALPAIQLSIVLLLSICCSDGDDACGSAFTLLQM
jgi:hypothetical protein